MRSQEVAFRVRPSTLKPARSLLEGWPPRPHELRALGVAEVYMAKFKEGDWVEVAESAMAELMVKPLHRKGRLWPYKPEEGYWTIEMYYPDGSTFTWAVDEDEIIHTTAPGASLAEREAAVLNEAGWRARRDANLRGVFTPPPRDKPAQTASKPAPQPPPPKPIRYTDTDPYSDDYLTYGIEDDLL